MRSGIALNDKIMPSDADFSYSVFARSSKSKGFLSYSSCFLGGLTYKCGHIYNRHKFKYEPLKNKTMKNSIITYLLSFFVHASKLMAK